MPLITLSVLCLCVKFKLADALPSTPRLNPTNPTFISSTWEWCDLGTGLENVSIWPGDDENQRVTIPIGFGEPVWLKWRDAVDAISWICDGMASKARSQLDTAVDYWMLQHWRANKILRAKSTRGAAMTSQSSISGRLKFSGWRRGAEASQVVFTSGEGGYSCIKIPSLLLTQNGSLLALAEARSLTHHPMTSESCSDFAPTALVIKRSVDEGRTWSQMQVVRSEVANFPVVIGNAAPVQLSSRDLRYPGRILLPHTRNNSEVWLMYSDNDGVDWTPAREIPDMVSSDWNWVGTGPPAGVQLQGGRVVVPCYHGVLRGNILNNLVHGHMMLSDDSGDTWRLASVNGLAENVSEGTPFYVNENQVVELMDGTLLDNARSLATFSTQKRIQSKSFDGGETWAQTSYTDLPQPLNGCEGSIVSTGVGTPPLLLFSGPDSTFLRTSMRLWASADEGGTWQPLKSINDDAAGYSVLQAQCSVNLCSVFLMYEIADTTQVVMAPNHFMFRRLTINLV